MSWWWVGVTISPAILMVTRDCFKVLHQSTLLYKPVHRECLRWIQSLCPCWKYSWVIVLWCESTERIEIAVSLRRAGDVWVALTNCSEHALIVHAKKHFFSGRFFWYLVSLTHLRTLCSHITAMTHPSTLVSCCLHDRNPYSQHCCGHKAPLLVFETFWNWNSHCLISFTTSGVTTLGSFAVLYQNLRLRCLPPIPVLPCRPPALCILQNEFCNRGQYWHAIFAGFRHGNPSGAIWAASRGCRRFDPTHWSASLHAFDVQFVGACHNPDPANLVNLVFPGIYFSSSNYFIYFV